MVVVGGGDPSRRYIKAAMELDASSDYCDIVGIEVTRLNARLLIAALKDLAELEPIKTIGEAIEALHRRKVPVMGGTRPGQTTDAVAAMLAHSSKSDLLIFFTDVDGVYTADPNVDPKARKFEKMKASQLLKVVGKRRVEPGMKAIVDPVGARIIKRARIRTLVLGREEINRLPQILSGAKHSGTEILPG